MKINWCRIFGHIPVKVDTRKHTAICRRCGKLLEVTYDMAYGETVVVKVIEEELVISKVKRVTKK